MSLEHYIVVLQTRKGMEMYGPFFSYDDAIEYAETTGCLYGTFLLNAPETRDQPDESMDGDHASALASAGWGTDEDYNTGDMI